RPRCSREEGTQVPRLRAGRAHGGLDHVRRTLENAAGTVVGEVDHRARGAGRYLPSADGGRFPVYRPDDAVDERGRGLSGPLAGYRVVAGALSRGWGGPGAGESPARA